jgi:serine/threonine-protein kinase
MGAVYRASHALLRRATAVKLLPPEKAGARNLARFEREVQLTAMLTHPNTVNIFDYGRTPQGVFYYAMEDLDGINLEELVIAYGPLEPARVIHILEQVCGSLSEAHAIGLVHRDIKPANIILCERGGIADTAKVVDFGLVKDIGAPQNGGSGLSQINTLLGTPLYMAPETITAPDRIDARSDLYALGAVAYFLLTGEPPFVGASVLEVCAKHLHETPLAPSLRLGRPLPPDLEAIVLACLAKKPEARPESAAVLGEALLACDLPRWSAAQARAWWDQEGAHARSIRPKPEPQSPQLLSTIAFDAESELYRAAAQ